MCMEIEALRTACAFCAKGEHHLCRPDVTPCGCAANDHPGRDVPNLFRSSAGQVEEPFSARFHPGRSGRQNPGAVRPSGLRAFLIRVLKKVGLPVAIAQQQLFETRPDHEQLSLPRIGSTYRATCRCGHYIEASSPDSVAALYREHAAQVAE